VTYTPGGEAGHFQKRDVHPPAHEAAQIQKGKYIQPPGIGAPL
jgi:hypothetical protein